MTGHKVVLIDKNIVGGSSSGRSAGFLTPDSELELHQLVRRYGVKAAGEIWDAPRSRGIERIVGAIQKHDIKCGLQKQDSLFLGLGQGRQGGRGRGAPVPAGSGLHRPAHLRRAGS